MLERGDARFLRAARLVVALGAALGLGVGSVSAATGMTTVQVPQAVCPPATARIWSCDAIRLATERVTRSEARRLRADGVARSAATPDGTGKNGGYSPSDLAAAYGVNPATATTQTVAIVDAYADPSVLSDLDYFDEQYGLPDETPSTFAVVDQAGSSSPLPMSDAAWAVEITLDVQTVRGLCHACKILLVEANSATEADLGTAVDTAVSMGATIVSNSYGGPESANDPYAADYAHPGVAILASTGDNGWYGWDIGNYATPPSLPQTPASFGTVVGVGGTSLAVDPGTGARTSETVWDDDGNEDANDTTYVLGASGGGCSTIYQAPPWESSVAGYASLGCGSGMRSGVDIAADADPNTGYDVYETTTGWCTPGQNDGSGNNACPNTDPLWQTYGGTSLASPLVAALWGLAGGPGGVAYPALTLYGHFQSTPSALYDVASGGNGYCGTDTAANCQTVAGGIPNIKFGLGLVDCRWDGLGDLLSAVGQCNAGPGFDGPSGVGTPNGLGAFAPLSPTAAIAPPSRVTQGVAATFSGAGSSVPFPGDSISQYAWNWGDGTTTTTSSPTTTHTYTTPGAHTVTLTVTDAYASDNGGRTGTAASGVAVIAVYTLAISRSGSGKGAVSSSPAGISCGATCSATFASGTALILTARPASGSTFAGWSGACSGKTACHVTLSAGKSVTAKFTAVCVVPRVTGDTLAAAKRALKRAHCAVGKVKGAKTGKVGSQRPGEHKKLAAGAKVNLTLGKRKK